MCNTKNIIIIIKHSKHHKKWPTSSSSAADSLTTSLFHAGKNTNAFPDEVYISPIQTYLCTFASLRSATCLLAWLARLYKNLSCLLQEGSYHIMKEKLGTCHESFLPSSLLDYFCYQKIHISTTRNSWEAQHTNADEIVLANFVRISKASVPPSSRVSMMKNQFNQFYDSSPKSIL